MDCCRARDGLRGDTDLGGRACRVTGPPATGWLARHGRPDVRAALWHVSFAVAWLAECRRECDAGHAQSVALELTHGILGATLEHGVSRARGQIHVPASATDSRAQRGHPAGLSRLGPDS